MAPARLSRRWRSWTLKVSTDAGGPVPARGFHSGSAPSLFWVPKSHSASQGPCPPLPACSCPLPRRTLPVWPRPIYSYGTGACKADSGLGPNKQAESGRGSQAGRVGGQERCLGTGWGSSGIRGSVWPERGSLPAPSGPTSPGLCQPLVDKPDHWPLSQAQSIVCRQKGRLTALRLGARRGC